VSSRAEIVGFQRFQQHHRRQRADAAEAAQPPDGVPIRRRLRQGLDLVVERLNGKARSAWAGRSGPFFAFFSVRGAPCYLPSACIRALRVEALGPEPW